MLTTERLLEQKGFQLMLEWVDRRWWNDIISHCIPDLDGATGKAWPLNITHELACLNWIKKQDATFFFNKTTVLFNGNTLCQNSHSMASLMSSRWKDSLMSIKSAFSASADLSFRQFNCLASDSELHRDSSSSASKWATPKTVSWSSRNYNVSNVMSVVKSKSI